MIHLLNKWTKTFSEIFFINLQTKKSEHISSLMMESSPFQTFKQINDFLADQIWEGRWHSDKTRHDHNKPLSGDLWDGITMLGACHPGDNEDFHTQWQPLSSALLYLQYRSSVLLLSGPRLWISSPAGHYTQHRPTQHGQSLHYSFCFSLMCPK